MTKDPKFNYKLHSKLRKTNNVLWKKYVTHPFVEKLAAGTLSISSFKYFLAQDYLFLIQLARAYALAAYKSDNLDDIRSCALGMSAIIDSEIQLHLDYCANWGLDKKDILATKEDLATIAYSRYVLDKGMQGDLLDLYVALSPCIIGYSEIGTRIAKDSATKFQGNPYRSWIELYSSADYQAVAHSHSEIMDMLWSERAGEKRLVQINNNFMQAVQLEVDFWQMGTDAGN
jgi:thiaminase/transcriptional activator TenA